MSKHGRILVAMSGGVDSSVAALMLHEQGYEVIGITMKTWDYAASGGSKKETGCCSLDSINDARELAVKLGFPHYILDIRNEFGDHIIDNFVEEYMGGRTPNPCVLCNTHIKWEALLKRAAKLDCEFIATGHYAQVRQENQRYVVSKGLDQSKDQSYVLWGLSQESLARTRFPLGGFRKAEIREMAAKSGFVDLANKSESYEICFIPNNDYREFLRHKVDGLDQKLAGGLFVDRKGNVLGKHQGYPFYTIGQRKGLDLAVGTPMYVLEILPESNTVVLGEKEDLIRKTMGVRGVNLIKVAEVEEDMQVTTKIRYKHEGSRSIINRLPNGDLEVNFLEEVSGIAPGQSAVFYDGNDVVGGGFIKK